MILVDTDILVDVLRGRPDTAETLDRVALNDKLATSIVTKMELIAGCRNKDELRYVGRLLEHFEIVLINEDVSEAAARLLEEYRLSQGLLIPDALIAATALCRGTALLTRNRKHFEYINGLELHAALG